MKEELIAPCGMNCAVCVNYLAREYDLNKKGFHKAYCEGCLPRGKNCLHMGGSCEALREGRVRFCLACKDFPCKRLKALDTRYRMKYHLSMIDNLKAIHESGMDIFLSEESKKWSCQTCGKTVCCHNGLCLNCRIDRLQQNKKHRWDEK